MFNRRLQAYFNRIAFGGAPRPDLGTLCQVLRCHILSVPFENLDVQLGRPVSTSPEAAYDKIVNNRRGGWCYEQNGLFGWALAEIGFKVTRLAAAVQRHERGDIATANHLCLRVNIPELDTDYLADVGFGGSMLAPITLKVGQHWQSPFRLGLQKLDDGYWRFWEDGGDGMFSFDFLAEAAEESALSARCDYLQSDPASSFVQNLVAQRRLEDGHKSLRGRVLTTTSRDGVTSETLNSATDVVATLADQFQLDVPDVKALWPRIVARHNELFSADETS